MNTKKTFKITLYTANLKTLANEFGDCLYGVHNPKKQFEERNKLYGTSQSDKFSFDYQYWIEGIRSKPNINDY